MADEQLRLGDEPEPDRRSGAQRRDEALRRVEQHADPQWSDKALQAARLACSFGAEFSTDEVWSLLEAAGVSPPREPKAMGAIMRKAGRLGLCEATERTKISTRPDCNARPVRIWRPR
jgi:hypothetical protein